MEPVLAEWRAIYGEAPPAEGDAPTEELSAEQIVAAAEKASEQEAWPEAKPPAQLQPIVTTDDGTEKEPFDPRFIVYVSIPALVLGGQLVFSFSRDALGDQALGPAVMTDLWMPF